MTHNMEISKDDLMLRYGDDLVNHLVIEALSNALNHDELEQFMEQIDWKDKSKALECYLVVEGEKFPILEVCKHWESQMDEAAKEKAVELLADKLSDIEELLGDIGEGILRKASDKLGIEFDNIHWR